MIEFVQVNKKYPKTNSHALKDINFKINEGEFVFLIGPSGSGKTTAMRMMIREEAPSTGKIFFDDHDITKLSRGNIYKLRRLIGVVFQDYKLISHKNAFENVAFAMEVAGQNSKIIRERVPELLEIVGLADKMHSFPNQLSGGEQQRVAIARAMANDPRVLVADEPTGNLDPASAWDIVQILSKINSWGTTVLMSTHGTDIVNSLNKRVIQLEKGLIVRDDSRGQYEFSKLDFGDQVLKSQEGVDGDEEKNKKGGVIKVDLRTDRIRERLRKRKGAKPEKIKADEEAAEIELAEQEEIAMNENMIEPIETASEPVAIESSVEVTVEEALPEDVSTNADQAIPENRQAGSRFSLSRIFGMRKPEPKVEEPKSNNKMSTDRVVDIDAKIDNVDAIEEEIARDAKMLGVERLDINEDLAQRLTEIGFKSIKDVIDAGPDKLLDTDEFSPLEVIQISQALGEFVDLEEEALEGKRKKPIKSTSKATAKKTTTKPRRIAPKASKSK